MSEKDIKRRQAYLDGYVDGRAGRSYARDYGKVIANTMDAVDRAYHTGYTVGEYARQAEKERDDDEMLQLPESTVMVPILYGYPAEEAGPISRRAGLGRGR
jgi:hypothetical protein